MIRLEPPLRVASEADAKALADLVNFAGEGLPLYIWEGLAKDGKIHGTLVAPDKCKGCAKARLWLWISGMAP